MDVHEALSSAHPFAAAGQDELTIVAAAALPRRLAKGQVLFVEGEHSEHLFVVVSGRLKILVSSPHGEQHVFAVLGTGESVGELSVLDRRPRSATAVALDAVQVIAVPAETVRAVLNDSVDLGLAWAEELASTVRRLTGSTADLVFLDLPRRLAKLLVNAGDTEVDLGMSPSEVAAHLGVARAVTEPGTGRFHPARLDSRGRCDGPAARPGHPRPLRRLLTSADQEREPMAPARYCEHLPLQRRQG